ncbi:iron complex outermembrane recepter protein [Chryseolinea serpens]|uniref:Iron complex outermembrane recepter protein n=1 Tax=Chryseolinea serpens TaxID=947013 RepID=A0A1M5RK76_9BACT|nr:TonB-dependent receptor [Chryseolinea serpens]SHH26233.1 iron complex outermembrane recepter protein [Chryseolinea serpens]
MKSIYLFLFLIVCHLQASAQSTGTVRGVVKTSDGQPAEFVNIGIEGSSKGVVADWEGKYELVHIVPGNYVIVASFVGLQTQKQSVVVKAGETTRVDFVLEEDTKHLEEIVVSSGRLNQESIYAAKMPLKNMENPQVYNAVSSDLLKVQAITSYDDALRNVPGIQRLWESTGRGGGDGTSYFSLRGFEAQANIVNGLPGLTNGSLDPANIERIEVIKGPSGTLFGSSLISYGGLVNTVTKRPYNNFGGEVSYMAGSFGLNRVTADINTPLGNEEKQVTLRVNTAYQTENSFQDAGFRNSFFVAPTLSYKVNDKLSFLILTEFMQEEKTNPTMLFLGRSTPLQFADMRALNYDRKLSLTSNDLSIKNPRYNLQGQTTYRISSQWTSQTVLSRGVAKSNGYYSYLYDNENGKGEFGLWMSKQQAQTVSTDIQQNFNGDFTLGNLRNRMVVGLDYFNRNIIDNSTGYAWIYNVTPQGAVNYVDPYTGVEAAPAYLTRPSVDNLIAPTGVSNSNSKDNTYSAYVSDVINLTPKLLAMASLRFDYFDKKDADFDQTALSPKFGLLYQPIADKLSVFANYMNGFKNVAPVSIADADGSNPRLKNFEAEHANQWELGVKSNLLSDKLQATVSYYDIEVANLVTGDPANPNNSLQGGKAESKGLEIDLRANPIPGLSLIAGYAHNESKVLEGDDKNVWLETGKRPIYAGPKDLVNAWATYTVTTGGLEGLGFGVGGNHASDLAILDSDVTGKFVLPGYTVVNATAFYRTNKFRVALNVNNITDKEYYTGYSTVNPQKPRNAVLSFSYKF